MLESQMTPAVHLRVKIFGGVGWRRWGPAAAPNRFLLISYKMESNSRGQNIAAHSFAMKRTTKENTSSRYLRALHFSLTILHFLLLCLAFFFFSPFALPLLKKEVPVPEIRFEYEDITTIGFLLGKSFFPNFTPRWV